MEIIEIGASLVDREGYEIGHFQRFVRPLRRPLLTPISQTQIDAAAALSEVWSHFEPWLGPYQTRLLAWVSWGTTIASNCCSNGRGTV